MTVLVVDDERRARERLARLLAALPDVDVADQVGTGLAALDAIPRLRPDAVFLDVQMPELSGFDVLRALPPADRPLVVFVTAHDRYAVQAFHNSAVDYLLKPVTPDLLARAVGRLRERDAQRRLSALVTHLQQTRPLQRVVGKQRHDLHVLPTDSIEAFIAEHGLVFALTSSGRYLIDKTLRELEASLDRDQFARVHKGVLVNLGKLQVLRPVARGGAVGRLLSGQVIAISRRYAHPLRHTLGW